MKATLVLILLLGFLGVSPTAMAQETSDPSLTMVDEIQFDLKSVKSVGDTLQIDLFAISYEKNPREFRLNVFASNLIDGDSKPHMFSSVQVGRVIVQLAQRQNYLNYLMHQDVPVPIRVKIFPTSEAIKKAKEVKLVFSSFEEEGRFLEAVIPLK